MLEAGTGNRGDFTNANRDFNLDFRSRVRFMPPKKVDTLTGISVNLISLKDLNRNKKASGRHKDLDDLENLP